MLCGNQEKEKENKMKQILVGFDEPKLLKTISRYVQKHEQEEMRFVTKTTKGGFIEEISSGFYDSALLMEECGKDRWTIDEIVQIKDSYNINLIPIITEEYKGTREITKLSNVGITSAVFIKRNGTYKADEIISMIIKPRTLREARVYYGITKLNEHLNEGDVNPLDSAIFRDAEKRLFLHLGKGDLGTEFIDVVSDFDVERTAAFIEQLDGAIIEGLKKTLEFYDVLDILRAEGKTTGYHMPKEIRAKRKARKKMKEGADADIVAQNNEKVGNTKVYTIYDVSEEDVRYVDDLVEEDDTFGFDETEGIDFDNEEVELDEIETSSTKPIVSVDDEFDDSLEGFLDDDNLKKVKPKKELLKKSENEISEPEKRKSLSEHIAGMDEEEEKDTKRRTLIGVGIGLIIVIFILMLVYLFLRISLQRRTDGNNSGYDALYNSGDVDTYAITDNGSPILYDEDGHVVYDGSASNEEMDLSVINDVNDLEPVVTEQDFNDSSAFEEGKQYKGLDLVNMLNGTRGCNCVLNLKNGASVNISRGNASIEDFKPSAYYTCSKDGNMMYLSEE